MNHLIQMIAATLLITAGLGAIFSMAILGRRPQLSPRTLIILLIAFIIVVTPKH